MTTGERINAFHRYWAERVAKGEVSSLTTQELTAISLFAEWEERECKQPLFSATVPVHWLVNVHGDPKRVRTACGCAEWTSLTTELLNPERKTKKLVTCPACLRAMEKEKTS